MIRFLKRYVLLMMLIPICLFFAALVAIQIGILFVKKGPKSVFYKKKRDVEPACLSDPALGTHGYLHLEDMRIHYVSNGSADKPLMLLLHGFPESWYSWRFQLKEFSKYFRVVALDMRGYGDSDKPSGIEQYKVENMVKDVKQIITALGYSSCVLVGHDWGGAVAWAFAGCYPDMVDKLVVLNCPHMKSFINSHWTQFKKSWYMFFFLIPVVPEIYISLSDLKFFEIVLHGEKGGVVSGATTVQDIEAYKYLFQNTSSLTGPINYIRAAFLCEPNPRMALKVNKPVLLIWGCRDLTIERGQVEVCREYAGDLTIKYLENANHWVQMDEPDKVNDHIKEFLSCVM